MRKLIRPLAFSAALGLTGSVGLTVLRAVPDEPKPATTPVKADAPAAPVKMTNEKIETKFAVTPKPLSASVKNGVAYLIKTQQEDGGWAQGGGWRTTGANGGRVEGKNVEDPSDIGNTCFVVLALIRAGSTPADGEHKAVVAKALKYILTKVEKADKDSLYVTDVKGTQLQSKIGPYVDTFLVNLVLAELKGKAGADEARLTAALEKTMNKIIKHQDAQGGFANNGGWAPTLSVGIANKSFARAKQNGVVVDDKVFDRAFAQSNFAARGVGGPPAGMAVGGAGFAGGATVASAPAATFAPRGRVELGSSAPAVAGKPAAPLTGPKWMTDAVAAKEKADSAKLGVLSTEAFALGSSADGRAVRGGAMPPDSGGGFGFGGGGGDAGIRLYSLGQGAGNAQDVVNSLRVDATKAEQVLKDAKASAGEKKAAQETVENFKRAETTNVAVQRELAANVNNPQFVAGFGSNGGEEFLSFLNISEALVVKGGKDWEEWDGKMVKGLEKAQDKDGSWAGHHCITGKTFCTAGALLVLMADRTPFPVDVINKEREKKEAKPESPTPDPAKPAAAIPVKP
jgi:hypothetical protein